MASQRLKTRQIKSDGSANTEPFDIEIVDPMTGERILDEKKQPCVVVTAKPMGQDEWQAILKSTERVERDDLTGQMVAKVDNEQAISELCRRSILDWQGIDGADDQPLVCNELTKPLLPVAVKRQVMFKVLGAEVVAAVDRASFREPAAVSSVVRG